MPSSRPNTIPTVIHLIRQLRPNSILDVGVGFGKWGHLFREYTDIIAAERDPSRYERKNWQVRIDGIEGHAAYLTEMHRFIYNDIHVGDACALVPQLSRYDVIFMGDIIEHLDKQRGQQLLRDAFAKANKAVIVSTPKHDTGQECLCGNELERHRSVWKAKDFEHFKQSVVTSVDGDTLVAVLVKPGVAMPTGKPRKSPKAADLRRMQEAKAQICRLIPADESFVLVDEEQIRSELPHTRVFPFLERNGQYWGPPADDRAAIEELKRLRAAGAKYIAFIWSTFWWLEHYRPFVDHLHSNFRCVHDNECSRIFDLTSSR